ncbi:head GIN domain-containing protein [Undibacterium sp. TJN25]|uniref:head GIN domain-containing protein n=1 Tax=Undibacterium sp. TJN25 TaxID=3413056 RepID=UPI003BF3076B
MPTSSRLKNGFCAAAMLLGAATLSTVPAHAEEWSIGSNRVTGSGKIEKQVRTVSGFNSISIGVPASVELVQDNTESVTIETDDNLLPQIETLVERGQLKIRTVKRSTNLETRTMNIVVRLKNVDSINLGGSGTISSGKLHAARLAVNLGGSGNVDIKALDAGELSIALGGSGAMKAAGTADSMSVAIGGSGKIDAGSLKAKVVEISIGGSGRLTVAARDSLSLTVAGSGDVAYYGDPHISKTVLGSGSLKRLGAFPM